LLFRKGAISARLEELRVVLTDRATTVAREDGTLRVGTVEHLFAALAGLGIREGIHVEVEGDELPILDGAARAWAEALEKLDPPRGVPRLVVHDEATIVVGSSTYEFRRGRATIGVHLDTDDPRLARDATWSSDPLDFTRRIAQARTFAFERDVPELVQRGLASHVNVESVVVIAQDRIHWAGARFEADEPARHKLLDLMGDFYLYGGPPAGSVHATRPGHGPNHEAIARAIASGILRVSRLTEKE
jgi:UDP-3-O-[3-hydroxymyristoyl] N-acetylglucosamine deacetylase